MENLDPHPPKSNMGGEGGGAVGVGRGLLFHFILSKIGVLEFLSFSWVNKLHLLYHPFI